MTPCYSDEPVVPVTHLPLGPIAPGTMPAPWIPPAPLCDGTFDEPCGHPTTGHSPAGGCLHEGPVVDEDGGERVGFDCGCPVTSAGTLILGRGPWPVPR